MRTIVILFLLLTQLVYAQRPKLVVGIVVDQMRYDHIDRYWEKYTDDGFKRIVNKGFFCKNTHFNYVPTYTGPGHASIYTGTTPSVHGIIGNLWFDRNTRNLVYCVGDADVLPAGTRSPAGKMSPKYLMSSTIGDELKSSTEGKAKVIGIAIKDRGAILPAGGKGDAAYWYDGTTGTWISSQHYMDYLPDWVREFNGRKLPMKYLSEPWNTLLPIEEYTESLPDDNPYEEPFAGKAKPVFPYDLQMLARYNLQFNLVKATPFGNTMTAEFAKAAIKSEALGQDDITDMLAVSFSSTDYIGHQFGPQSIEVQDAYLRLDRDLADLLEYLDEQVGRNDYLLFLTSDHGAVDVPAHLKNMNKPGGYFDDLGLQAQVDDGLLKKFGHDSLVLGFNDLQFYLDTERIADEGLDLKEIEKAVVEIASGFGGVAIASTAIDLMKATESDSILMKMKMGYHPKLSGDVLLHLKPGWINWKTLGTTHGSGYHYDTHVPLIWYGVGIKKGTTSDYVAITDIAATLSQLLKIAKPSGCTGKPILDLLK